MKRAILLAPLALLAVPGAALAAPVKISPHAVAVSDAGAATVEVANPNRYALRGAAAVTAGSRTVAKRKVRLAKRSVTGVKLRFGPQGVAAVRAAGGRVTVKLRLRRPDARRHHGSADAHSAPPLGRAAGAGAAGSAAGDGARAARDSRWVGRMGTEGAYGDLELTVTGGQLQITKAPVVPVSCFAMGGSYGSAISFELFDAPGPWTIGTDGLVAKQGIAVNQLVGGGARTINYKVTGSTQQAGSGRGHARDVVRGLQVRHLHQQHHLHQLRRLAVLRRGAGRLITPRRAAWNKAPDRERLPIEGQY